MADGMHTHVQLEFFGVRGFVGVPGCVRGRAGGRLPGVRKWGWLANLPETETETETETCAFQFLVLFGHSLPPLVLR